MKMCSEVTNADDVWRDACLENGIFISGDILKRRFGYYILETTDRGDRVQEATIKKTPIFYSFSHKIQKIRERMGIEDNNWCQWCHQLLPGDPSNYSPRWCFPFCYFKGRALILLSGLRGLDLGARVNPVPRKAIEFSDELIRCDELSIPHYEYYQSFGIDMIAIDVLKTANPKIIQGDLRCIPLPSHSIDFITMPMILGLGNPLNTYIDITLAISELFRVTKNDCLIYIADFILRPDLIYFFSYFGFSIFAACKVESDLPVGLILLKQKRDDSFFRYIVKKEVDLTIPRGEISIIKNRSLLTKGTNIPIIFKEAAQHMDQADSLGPGLLNLM